MIAEPTLEYYVYYLRQVEGDDHQAVQERRAAFAAELRALLCHLEQLSGQAIPAWDWPSESQDRRVSQRIVRTGWLDNPAAGRSCFVEARTYGDVYWLQVGYYQRDPAGPEIFARLRDVAWRPAAAEHRLGQSAYLCGIAPAERDELAARTLTAYIGDPPGALAATHLADGPARLYGSRAHPHVAVLLYPDAGGEAWAGQTWLNDVAPRLELYRHKADRQLAWCEQRLPLLADQERALRDLLDQAQRASPTDPALWRRLTRLYRAWNGNRGLLAGRQTTVQINLDNLDAVLQDVGTLAADRFLGPARAALRQRHRQLEADLQYADQLGQQADAAINALRVELGLDRWIGPPDGQGDAAVIAPGGWPGALPPVESEMSPLTPHHKPAQPVVYPRIEVSPLVTGLTAEDRALLQHVYRGFGQVLVENEFGGGYSGARVLLNLPVTPGGLSAARQVTKLGPAPELRRERDNYAQYVEAFLPFCVARVDRDRYCEQGDLAGLNYVFVGGGALGQVRDLQETYRRTAPHTQCPGDDVGRLVKTLDDLLDRELGQRWYSQATPLHGFFAAEYGPHLVEHLRLRLRPGSPDALWPAGQPPAPAAGYRPMEPAAIPGEHEALEPGVLRSVEGLVVQRIKPGEVKLQDPDGRGVVVRVEFAPGSPATQGLELGCSVGVRGLVVYNRRGRLEQIARAAFPDLAAGVGGESLAFPDAPGVYPNPLHVYPRVLGRTLAGRQSYVHGDLHLRNVLVDEWGKGWLIDFARVGRQHNLFDFIKLETYIRLMALPGVQSPGDCVRFEEALNEDGVACPADPHLQTACQVIRAIRRIARNYMAPASGWQSEYFPALFLYCLAVSRYYRADLPQPTRRVLIAAAVLARYL